MVAFPDKGVMDQRKLKSTPGARKAKLPQFIPPQLATLAVLAAQVRPEDRVLEPSAGTGLMAVVSLPRPFVFRLDMEDPHPFPWIRVKLSIAMGHAPESVRAAADLDCLLRPRTDAAPRA